LAGEACIIDSLDKQTQRNKNEIIYYQRITNYALRGTN